MDYYQSGGGQMSGSTAGQGTYGQDAAGQGGYGNGAYTPGNPYGQTAYGGGNHSAGSYGGTGGNGVPEPPKKKNKLLAMLLLALGPVCILGGIGALFFATSSDRLETAEPTDVYEASETDQYVSAPVQYMTESVAYYEAMDKMQFYITFDADWNPSVVCLHDEDLPIYQPYIEWLYSESYENEPEQISAAGYAQPFDRELQALVIEGFEDTIGTGYVDEDNFSEWFGDYYVQIGQKSSAYGVSNAGIYVMLGGIALVVIGGAMLYDKNALRTPEQNGAQAGPVIRESRAGLGILGAALGALLGGLLWTVVGALGYVSGWIGLLIIFFGYTGYKLLAKKEGIMGKAVSLILGLLVIIPATYLSYIWMYYRNVNETVGGYTTIFRAFAELPAYMTNYGVWGDFAMDILLGYLFFAIAGIYWLIGSCSSRSKQKKEEVRLRQAAQASSNLYGNSMRPDNPYERQSQSAEDQNP